MRNRPLFLSTLALALAFPLAAQEAALEQSMDALLQKWAEGFNAGDAAALASLYAEDGDAGGFTGRTWTGRAAIQEAYAGTLENVKGSSIEFTRTGLHALSPDVVVLDASWEVSGGTITEGTPTKGFFTLVLTKAGDAWQIFTSRVKIPPPAS